jgi:hypothetical protein
VGVLGRGRLAGLRARDRWMRGAGIAAWRME